jgi:hypothetical protein
LLRYVYVNDNFLNKTLAREGLAEAFFCMPYMKNCPLVLDEKRKEALVVFHLRGAEGRRKG